MAGRLWNRRNRWAMAGGPPAGAIRRYSDGYSLFVYSMKWLLPVVGAALLALVFIWPSWSDTVSSLRNSILTSFKPDEIRNLQMVEPRYEGVDDRNRPFRLTAKIASQTSPNADKITLKSPRGRLTGQKGGQIIVAAKAGEYSQKKKRLILSGNVNILHDNGYSFRTEIAVIDLQTGAARGDKPVTASGPKGTLDSQGFRIRDKGNVVVFRGKTRIVLKVDSGDVDGVLDKPPAAKPAAKEKTGRLVWPGGNGLKGKWP